MGLSHSLSSHAAKHVPLGQLGRRGSAGSSSSRGCEGCPAQVWSRGHVTPSCCRLSRPHSARPSGQGHAVPSAQAWGRQWWLPSFLALTQLVAVTAPFLHRRGRTQPCRGSHHEQVALTTGAVAGQRHLLVGTAGPAEVSTCLPVADFSKRRIWSKETEGEKEGERDQHQDYQG